MKIPSFNKGIYISALPCGNQCKQDCYKNVSYNDVKNFKAELLKSGFTLTDELVTNYNLFATLSKDDELVNLSYTDFDKTLRILKDPLIETAKKPNKKEHTPISDPSLAVIPLDYSHREITDGNGMCFIINLTDGGFVIIDGGYGFYSTDTEEKESRDADKIYSYLKENNLQNSEKIKIAAWIFTHPHADHYGAFIKFDRLYGDSVEIESFIFNDGDPSTYAEKYQPDDFLRLRLPNIIKSNYPHAKIIKPHVGQTLDFCGVTIKILFTQELCAPDVNPATNDASLVFKLEANGTQILFLADADSVISDRLVKIYGDALKSDIMQVNHHGYSGATVELYDSVAPNQTIWTTSQETFELRTTGKKYEYVGNAVESNKYIFDKLGSKNCIVADNTITHVIFDKKGYRIE